MYRPTVRYDDVYREYINDIFRVTTLDRNQIMRLALFTAPFNKLFIAQIEAHTKGDVPLPSPKWAVYEHGLWREQSYSHVEREDAVNDETEAGFTREVYIGEPSPVIRSNGGTIRLQL